MLTLLENKVNENDYTAMDVAAALLKMSLTESQETSDDTSADYFNTGAEEGMVRLFINIGKNQKVNPEIYLEPLR
jgi:ATP-dependent RNA helicase DeaD